MTVMKLLGPVAGLIKVKIFFLVCYPPSAGHAPSSEIALKLSENIFTYKMGNYFVIF